MVDKISYQIILDSTPTFTTYRSHNQGASFAQEVWKSWGGEGKCYLVLAKIMLMVTTKRPQPSAFTILFTSEW